MTFMTFYTSTIDLKKTLKKYDIYLFEITVILSKVPPFSGDQKNTWTSDGQEAKWPVSIFALVTSRQIKLKTV